MVDAARQMLDELMGRNRNLHPSEAGLKVNWEDPEFCQFYNVKFCPHDLFINTRADLGPCARIHDEEAKHLYEEARPARKRQYEDEFLRFCNVMLHDVDRKIQKGKQRLQLMQRDHPPPTLQLSKHQDQLNTLNARINKLLAEAEEAGIRGDVDQAQDLMTLCEEVKEEKEQLLQQYDASRKASSKMIAPDPSSADDPIHTSARISERSRDYVQSRQTSDRRHHHHKSHHGHTYSRNGSNSNNNNRSRQHNHSHSHYRQESRERHARSRSRSRY
ncbi:GL13371 [Drosophila persimilis]|uniref:GL13371 n=1 Tax=Drosophila persimilis TaxID=7234 RepID=B4H333_DROPE|nr:GL13371 [Drosophila persimilis]